jgi:hypothetical protein
VCDMISYRSGAAATMAHAVSLWIGTLYVMDYILAERGHGSCLLPLQSGHRRHVVHQRSGSVYLGPHSFIAPSTDHRA